MKTLTFRGQERVDAIVHPPSNFKITMGYQLDSPVVEVEAAPIAASDLYKLIYVAVRDNLKLPKDHTKWSYRQTRFCRGIVVGNSEWLDQLQPIQMVTNTKLTEFAKLYHSKCIHTLDVDEAGKLVPGIVEAPDFVVELTKPKQLRKGIVGTLPITWFDSVHPMKRPKRLKLITGWETVAELPDSLVHPKSVKILVKDDPEDLAPGIILISREVAAECKILGSDGEYHQLETGDKLCGVVDTGGGILVKATVVVANLQGSDMVIGSDVNKGVVEYNDYTKVHVQARAAERISSGTISLSYQLMQFFPELAKARAYNLLNAPRRFTFDLDGHTLPAPSIRRLIEGTVGDMAPAEVYADLFRYPVEIGGIPSWDITTEGRSILMEGTSGHESSIKTRLVSMLDKVFNPPARGAWLVAVPNKISTRHKGKTLLASDLVIKIPRSVWEELGRPSIVAVTRYPIKGRTSVVKLICKPYDGHCAVVSALLMSTVWRGDFDGDLLCVIADQDVVDVATDMHTSYKLSRISIERATKVVLQVGKDMAKSMGVEFDPEDPLRLSMDSEMSALEIAQTLSDMDQMGIATTLRDEYYSHGGTEANILALFETIVQPAIDRKEGRMILNPLEILWPICRMLQIKFGQVMTKVDGNIRARVSPSIALACLRGRHTIEGETVPVLLEEVLEVANSGATDPHSVIVSTLKGIKLGF
jgi:hypothetical protein